VAATGGAIWKVGTGFQEGSQEKKQTGSAAEKTIRQQARLRVNPRYEKSAETSNFLIGRRAAAKENMGVEKRYRGYSKGDWGDGGGAKWQRRPTKQGDLYGQEEGLYSPEISGVKRPE